MKKIILGIFIFAFVFGLADFCFAQENTIEVDFFYSPTCPHCSQEKKFLDEIEKNYSQIKINRYSISEKESFDYLKILYSNYNVPREYQGAVPITFLGSNYFLGFSESIGEKIEACIIKKIESNSNNNSSNSGNLKNDECNESISDNSIMGLEEVNFPIIGEINIKNYSPPVLAIVLGVLDGFNVCSLGALVLILGLVLALKSRKKTLIFGGIFILTTAVIYGILIVVWYNIFTLLVSYMKLMQALIGLLGLGGGAYFLKQFLKFRKQGPVCQIDVGKSIMAKFSSKFQKSLQESKNIILILGSILLFAIIITIVEFPCSAVVPVAFAGVLAQANLSTFNYLFYISIFVLFYMIDEIIVFLIAFFTMKIWLASSKAIIWITLAEALILFFLGVYYLYSIF